MDGAGGDIADEQLSGTATPIALYPEPTALYPNTQTPYFATGPQFPQPLDGLTAPLIDLANSPNATAPQQPQPSDEITTPLITLDNISNAFAFLQQHQPEENTTSLIDREDSTNAGHDVEQIQPTEDASPLCDPSWRSELPLLNFEDGDTYVYIDPPRDLLQSHRKKEPGYAWALRRQYPMLVHSQKLLASNSKFFQKAFGSTYQHRILRRRRLVGRLPEHVKYVVDLTLPEDGEDASLLCADVMCSSSLLWWHMSSIVFRVQADLVCGLDDDEAQAGLRSTPAFAKLASQNGQLRSHQTQPSLEFSPVRLHSAMERLVHILEGQAVRLDSAPKMWSLFCVARFFDCLSAIQDLTLSWLYSHYNSRFIEVLPEISLRIAEGLQNEQLCRNAFAVIVGEISLCSQGGPDLTVTAAPSMLGNTGSLLTPYGRVADDNIGQLEDALQHARLAFTERVLAITNRLAAADWVDNLVCTTPTREHPLVAAKIAQFRTQLKSYIQGRVATALALKDTSLFNGYAFDHYVSFCAKNLRPAVHGSVNLLSHQNSDGPLDFEKRIMLVEAMPPQMRVFTRSFWATVRNEICAHLAATRNIAVADAKELSHIPVVRLDPLFKLSADINASILMLKAESGDPDADAALWSKPTVQPETSSIGARNLSERESKLSSPVPAAAIAYRLTAVAAQAHPLSGHSDVSRSVHFESSAPSSEQPVFTTGSRLPYRSKSALKSSLSNGGPSTNSLAPQHLSDGMELDELASDHSKLQARWIMFNREPPYDFCKDPELLDTASILNSAYCHIMDIADKLLEVNVYFDPGPCDTLLCLEDTEWKFLPLWAGGLDDGSGGVFAEQIPDSAAAMTAGNLRGHGPYSEAGSSGFTMVNRSDTSGAQTSLQVMDGFSDTLHRKAVYAADDVDSLAEFSDLGDMEDRGTFRAYSPSIAVSQDSLCTQTTDQTEYATDTVRAKIAMDAFMLADQEVDDMDMEVLQDDSDADMIDDDMFEFID